MIRCYKCLCYVAWLASTFSSNQAELLEKYNNFFSWPVVKRSQKYNFYCFVSNFFFRILQKLRKKSFLESHKKKVIAAFEKFKTLWHLFLKRVWIQQTNKQKNIRECFLDSFFMLKLKRVFIYQAFEVYFIQIYKKLFLSHGANSIFQSFDGVYLFYIKN